VSCGQRVSGPRSPGSDEDTDLDGPRSPRRPLAPSSPGAAAALLARDPAAHAALDNPGGVAVLLGGLREAGAEQQAAALAERLPAAGMFGLSPGPTTAVTTSGCLS